jgi:hypothetical protein
MSSQADPARTVARPSDAEIQAMLANAVRLYVERVADTEGGLPAFPADAQVTATDVMVTATAMLKAVKLQVFELGMWQTWSGRS